MVSLSGAHTAQPLATEIDKLQVAFDVLNTAANDATASIWKMDINVYLKQISNAISIEDTFSIADSQAILFTIRNIIGTRISILTNQLGEIT